MADTTLGRTGDAAIRPVRLAQCRADLRRDGEILYLDCPEPLEPFARCLTERLAHWAEAAPDRDFIAERDGKGGWRTLTYAAAYRRVRRLAAALLARGLGPQRPLAILSGNDIEHALLGLACQHVGIPVAPISPAYSLVSTDYVKLRHIMAVLQPGLIYVAKGGPFAKAVAEAAPIEAEVVVGSDPIPGRRAVLFEALMQTPPGPQVDAAYAAVGPDTIAKVIFTSGSTGLPKGVITTQRMLCANQQQLRQTLLVLQDEPPVIVDWLPWNHTFGGSHNFGIALYNGGTFYIDDGGPTAAGMARSARNIIDARPTLYFNVPKGYEALVPQLLADADLREAFYSRLRLTYVSAAYLAPPIWAALDEISVTQTGERTLMLSGLGATESAPFALWVDAALSKAGGVGLPCPGLSVKLVPNNGKLEARLAGPNVSPGYWNQPELTAAAFDAEGYYRLGDALRLVDPQDAAQGLVFDGRLSEDFKLSSGTWVSVGPLRARFLALSAPYARDVVLAGLNRGDVRALVFPDLTACRVLSGLDGGATAAQVLASAPVRAQFEQVLRQMTTDGGGGSARIAAAILMLEAPSLDAGEITDKGSINQRAVLERRADRVDRLYDDPAAAEAILSA